MLKLYVEGVCPLHVKWVGTKGDPNRPRSNAFKKAINFHFLTQQKLDNFRTRMPERFWRTATFSPRCPKSI